MAVSANRKAQAGFLCPVRAPPPPFFRAFLNLTKNIGAFQMQCDFSQAVPSNQTQNIQNQAQTVTIPHKLANDAADACFYADRASENRWKH
ncbi:hypothetical protein JY21_06885 [Neisseria meningitidis]|nr:hypothetical protein JY21_06885 [Neisseria meningitidis]